LEAALFCEEPEQLKRSAEAPIRRLDLRLVVKFMLSPWLEFIIRISSLVVKTRIRPVQ
jgi:hypothetical protein